MAKAKPLANTNKKAKSVIDIATRETGDTASQDAIKSAAAALGRKGGSARAAALTAKKRSEIAKKAAKARWHKLQ